jgi:hypothetical protein
MRTVTDPKIKEKLRGEQLELEGLRDDDFEKYLQGLSLKNDIPITSDYPGFALKTFGSKKLSTVLDFVETGVGKYGAKKTAKWWANFAMTVAGLGLAGLAFKTYVLGKDVVNLIGEKTGLDEFSTINRLVDWSKLSEPQISVNGTKISACPGNTWCGIGISKTQFKLIDSSIGIFVTKTPLNGENYIYKFVPTDLTDINKDYVIVVPKDSGSLSVEMKTAINEYIKQATGKDYYTAQELNKKSTTTTTTATGSYTEDATGALKWAKTLNSNITEVKNLVKGKTDDDGTVNYTATLVLPAGPVDGYNLKFKNGNWSKG